MIVIIIAAVGGALVLLGLKYFGESLAGVFAPDPVKREARELADNHAAAELEAHAKTDGEADAALRADARSDRT